LQRKWLLLLQIYRYAKFFCWFAVYVEMAARGSVEIQPFLKRDSLTAAGLNDLDFAYA